jgi:hypothetical protein
MDVINISLGVSGGWQENILAVMADRLVSKGIHGTYLLFFFFFFCMLIRPYFITCLIYSGCG